MHEPKPYTAAEIDDAMRAIAPDDQAELDRQDAATELQTLLGVPPGTQGVQLPE